MVDSLQKALNSFHLISCFLGFGMFRNNLGYSRFCFSIIYTLIVWSVYICIFCYIVIHYTLRKIFGGILIISVIMTNFFVTIISVIIIICEYKKYFMYVKNLSLVDDTLEQLGTLKEYCKMRNLIKWILIVWFMTICITFSIDAYLNFKKFQEIKTILIPLIKQYPFHLNTFVDIIFIFLIRNIGIKLDKINDYIEQLSKIKKYELRCTWKKSRYYIQNTENHEHVLWIVMHLHLELCRIARNINAFFGMQLIMQMICYFVFLIGIFYFQYHILNSKAEIFGEGIKLILLIHSNIWCSIYLTKLVTLNYICESVSTKAEKTKNIIHKLTDSVCFDRMRKDICQFILQLSLRPLKFNGMGFFYFGYKFIYKFAIGIVSILIVMMQVDTSPLFRILISEENNATHITK